MSEAEKKPFSNPAPPVHHALALWAAECAKHTLYVFEERSPSDVRPRRALEVLRAWVRGEVPIVTCRKAAFAAHAAARQATEPSAVAAARATGQAAAVAHMWNHAPYTAEYAAKAASLVAPQEEADSAQSAERNWQWEHLREDLHPLGFPRGK